MKKESTVRQQEIIASVRKIIIAKGMEHLTVREIAKDLRITDGALYRHFKSKREILMLLIDDIEETLLGAIKNAVVAQDSPVKKLEAIFRSHLSYAEQRKGVSFIVINKTLSVKDKGLQKRMLGVINKYLKTIKSILKEGIEVNHFRKDINFDAASIGFFGMIQSIVTIWSLSGYRYALRSDRLSELFRIYKSGITE